MIQIVFTDNGKVHTVTFSGEDAKYWANRFEEVLFNKNFDFEIKELGVFSKKPGVEPGFLLLFRWYRVICFCRMHSVIFITAQNCYFIL